MGQPGAPSGHPTGLDHRHRRPGDHLAAGSSLTLQTFYQDGNLELPAIASERARTDPRPPHAG